MVHQAPLIAWPVRDGSRVPFDVFTRADVFAREQEAIFRGPVWNYVALEAELPQPGDFKTSFVGDTPIVVSRAEDGSLHAFVNRCAHRGATVQRQASGNTRQHRCVYHQWCYNMRGELIGVPYRRGAGGTRGYAADFDAKDHGLAKLRVASRKGLVFATFHPATIGLEDYLDAPLLAAIDRLFARPVKVLGHMRQRVRGNWKLYAENTRDPYHAALLHGFHATFGTYRTNQKRTGGSDRARAHTTGATYGDDWRTAAQSGDVGQDKIVASYSLADPSLMEGRPDFDDGVTVAITSIFPSLVIQQIMNTLATRHIRPKAADEFELYWTYFGYAGDDEQTTAARLKQANLVGPAGLISMEDSEAIELIQRAIVRDGGENSFLEFGEVQADLDKDRQGEASIRAFWRYYATMMDPPSAPKET
ncbi:MAG TPA: Rieske 2Fe-2S domain-containing protein [Reyranella sp.]|nr:Rieske 2Fe-2S domain-containing protein [Reyranella sp.]